MVHSRSLFVAIEAHLWNQTSSIKMLDLAHFSVCQAQFSKIYSRSIHVIQIDRTKWTSSMVMLG